MIDIKELVKSSYAKDTYVKKSLDIPDNIFRRMLRKSCRKLKKTKVAK